VIARAERLLRVSLTVQDLALMEDFYCTAFGFVRVGGGALSAALLRLLGAPDTTARSSLLRLGAEHLELVQFDAPGRPYPSSSTARDPWFQHIAIVVADMGVAYDRIRRLPIRPISEGGPQRLPPDTGSVVAFKFRDPESHPLELIQFAPGAGDPIWRRPAAEQLFLGFDHSAIVVADASLSERFYASRLGLSELSRSLNHGPEQQRLDGLPEDLVDVVGLAPAAATTPHLELLGYHHGETRVATAYTAVQDAASARLVFEVDRLAQLKGLTMEDGSCVAQLLDPDGHRLLLVERSTRGTSE
jgi:catechol 2,3-dioxygenase-like lactoylglutathione lyase family enzyme